MKFTAAEDMPTTVIVNTVGMGVLDALVKTGLRARKTITE